MVSSLSVPERGRVLCSVSVIAGDLGDLRRVVQLLSSTTCDYVHLDVMDGHFVPNLTFGSEMVRCLRPFSQKIFDVHLMMDNVERYLDEYIEAGSDIISIHVENEKDPMPLLAKIRKCNKKASLAFNPSSSLVDIERFFPELDQILLMSVNPGFSGQKFMEKTLDRVAEVREKIRKSGYSIDIQVDGGVNAENAPLLREKGCNVLVAGSFVLSAENLSTRDEIEIALRKMRGYSQD